MNRLILFTDGSVAARVRIGYGAYLLIRENDLSSDSLKEKVKVTRFENTSSTKLELQTLIWALNDIKANGEKILIYTDSQNIAGLPKKLDRLEKSDFHSRKNSPLRNGDLYRDFFRITSEFNCEIVKIKGHLPLNRKTDVDKCFSMVDKASRKALRTAMMEL